ncbi:unnamed protein product [Discula destructiva]
MMDEASHADDELMALLQPAAGPEEFDFASNLPPKDASGDTDGGEAAIPGAEPPAPMASMMMMGSAAPMAPMAPMDTTDPHLQSAPDPTPSKSLNGTTNGFGSSQPEDPKHSQQGEDEDEIAYEPVKTPSRASRSGRSKTSTSRMSATRPHARRKPGSSKSKASPHKSSTESKAKTNSQPNSKSRSEEREVERRPSSPIPPPSLEFEILISPARPGTRQEYQPIPPGDEIYRVLQRIPTGVPGETWLSVEFEDGHVDQVS